MLIVAMVLVIIDNSVNKCYVLTGLAGPVQIAQLCHLYSVENLLEHNT